MKTLYLVRHAKSSWADIKMADFDRPLNERGMQQAPLMGKKLSDLEASPDLIIASPAKRTTETITVIAKEINYPFDKIKFETNIYQASLHQLLRIINTIPNAYHEVLLVGHNPGVTSLSNHLTGDYIGNMPTCSITKIELHIDNWEEASAAIGTKKYFVYPKMFKAYN